MTTTTNTPTFDDVLTLAHKLPRRDRAQLIARLALDLGGDDETQRDAPDSQKQGDPRAVVAAVLRAGPWEGDDLEQRLAEVYVARAPLEAEP